jgi:predicted Zn-dependent protease
MNLRQGIKLTAAAGLFVSAAATVSTSVSQIEEQKLPDLGNNGASLISNQHEYDLGRTWLMQFRRQAPTVNDPLLTDYLEHLLYQLAANSELVDRRLDLVVVDNPTMNAFAVPGGVVGVHNGLFKFAENEDQLASVLAHELAHLSQRHFARRVEQQQAAYLPTMAGLLAGLVLAATAGGGAGVAAITATQAAALQSQLNYSRLNEQEADRIGMATMVRTGMSPDAVGDMFERMQYGSRYSRGNIPEFLLTHPITSSRIADARGRAANLPPMKLNDNFDYHLMQARVKLHFTPNNNAAIIEFRSRLKNPKLDRDTSLYGLSLALTRDGQFAEAREGFEYLRQKDPSSIIFIVGQAELWNASGETSKAKNLLDQQLRYNPNNHPLTIAYINTLRQQGDFEQAESLLTSYITLRKADSQLWYQLAEIRGLKGNIIGLHEARAEYYMLNGAANLATEQLSYGLTLAKNNKIARQRMQQRIREIQLWIEKVSG